MTNIDRAEEFLYNEIFGDHEEARRCVEALADAGLLAPEPHVVESVAELEALPVGTVLRPNVANVSPVYQQWRGAWWQPGIRECAVVPLPATVLTPARPPGTRKAVIAILRDHLHRDTPLEVMADAILALWPGRTERAVAEAAWDEGFEEGRFERTFYDELEQRNPYRMGATQ